jgi:methylglyoxal synthase
VSTIRRFEGQEATGTTSSQLIENEDLKVSVQVGDPTAGDSTVTVYVNYRLIPA